MAEANMLIYLAHISSVFHTFGLSANASSPPKPVSCPQVMAFIYVWPIALSCTADPPQVLSVERTETRLNYRSWGMAWHYPSLQ